MEKGLVSIIMPNYNGEDYIAEAIESVLHQTYEHFELIVVDDGSTDGSLDIIRKYQDDRIKLYDRQENEQICVALNYGISRAKGEFFARIDSDDVWEADKLEKQLAYINAHPECRVCFTHVIAINEFSQRMEGHLLERLFNQRNRSQKEWIKHLYFVENCFCHASCLCRLEDVRNIGGYDNRLLQAQDYDLWLRFLLTGSIHVLEEPLVRYRRVEDGKSISANSEINAIRSWHEFYLMRQTCAASLTVEDAKELFDADIIIGETEEEKEVDKAIVFYQVMQKEEIFYDIAKVFMLEWLGELLCKENTRIILKEKYQYTCKDYYRECGTAHYWFGPVKERAARQDARCYELENRCAQLEELLRQERLAFAQREEQLQIKQQDAYEKAVAVYETQIKELSIALAEMQNAACWKITKPLRVLLDGFKRIKMRFLK